MKEQLYRRIAERIAVRTPVTAANVFIVVLENTDANWSFGNGVAQMVAGAPHAGEIAGNARNVVTAHGEPAGNVAPGVQRRRLLTAELGVQQVSKVHAQEIRFAPGQTASKTSSR